ncbi:MAG TPA: branched-chain amino acid ABC transporter permease [Gaiellales bacterium]|nr:branched-chain amino acid ABC transporter permease [Gaiellales bacterium]
MLIVELLLNGILLGALYACVGMSFSLSWGVMNIVNLAHGSMIMLGAYVAFVLGRAVGLDPFLAIPVSAGVLFVVGYALQRFVINRVMGGSIFLTLILTFGFDMLLSNVLIALFTADTRSLTPPYAGAVVTWGGLRISYVRILVLVIALGLAAGLHLFLARTRAGRAILATSFDREAAQLTGVEIRHVFPLTFGIGAALAGAVGPLLAMTTSFSPMLGGALTMRGFVVVVLGGLGSIPGAVVGGFALGIVEHLSTLAFGSGYQETIGFVVLVAVLVLRPAGFLGKPFFAEVKT